ncbi:beta-N-acetylglucosaminidase domain-containing protein [Streptomyces sp. GKU 257-1]|nr:beta-N-acetylglucosaminidase domain-containing protein [Streptomyces sp. GKU 257-1]
MSAAALAAAVVSGLLAGAPAAQAAAPAAPDGPSAGSRDDESTRDGLPPVWPRPQKMHAQGGFVPVSTAATLIADEDADPHALRTVRATLRAAGVRTLHERQPGGDGRSVPPPPAASSYGWAPSRPAPPCAPPRATTLPAGGYRLAAGRADGHDTVALEGTDGAGLFNAAQTLRQLATEHEERHGFPGVSVRDWPTASVRGTTEGFYGQPWTQQERLSQLDFMGRTKQNRYLYAPGDDPFRQAPRWRDPYPAAQRADFRELADRAARNHVTLGWAVSPGQGLCFSSPGDRKALLRKLDAMRALGVGAFQLRFEDVSYTEWHCDQDADTYGSGPAAAARAQAELANAVADHLATRHPDAAPLSVVPTEFYQKGRTEYRAALAEKLDDRVEIGWSGVGGVPRAPSAAPNSPAHAAPSPGTAW